MAGKTSKAMRIQGYLKYPFSKTDRILKRSEFLRLSRSGKKFYNRHFIANVRPAAFERTRLGITVTKRVGNAVIRNRMKRLCREYFRLNKHRFARARDINIVVKTNAATLSTEQFFSSMHHLFDKINSDGH